ncbi:MAG: hypothetical protein ACU0A4_03440 [Paracoccaceae bacterium]|jgi:DNA-binding NtrC family response regulator|nr:hypothetical protein [Paracoccaceae bacterium]
MKTDHDNAGLRALLLLDSDVLVRAALATYLRDCGLTVIEASDTAEARTVLATRDVAVDIIFCDVASIGSAQSFAFAQWVRTECHDIPVLLAGSIDGAASLANNLCEEGPQLSKPYDHAQFLDTLKQTLARRHRNAMT